MNNIALQRKRIKLPRQLEADLLHKSHHICNICNAVNAEVNIHHIDGDPSNFANDNLIVLCLKCHGIVERRGQGRSYGKIELLQYRNGWEDSVRKWQESAIPVHRDVPEYEQNLLLKEPSPAYKAGNLDSSSERKDIGGQLSDSRRDLYNERHYIHLLAKYLFDKKLYQKALEVFDHISKSDPVNKVYGLINKARLLDILGKKEELLGLLDYVARFDPLDKETLIILSHLHLIQENYNQALHYSKKALSEDPRNPYAMIVAMESLFGLGNLNKSVVLHENYLKIQPINSGVLYHTGVIYCMLNKHKRAIPFFRRALKISPENPDYHLSLGLELEHNAKVQEAFDAYNRMAAALPASGKPWHAQGALFCTLNNHLKALHCFDKSIILEPSNPGYYYAKALELYHLNKKKDALRAYNDALKLNPLMVTALINRSHLLWQTFHQYEKALQGYNKALRIEPTKIEGLEGKARLLIRLGRQDEALPLVLTVKQIDSNHNMFNLRSVDKLLTSKGVK